MSKKNVMVRDVEDIMIFVDEKVEEIRRCGLVLKILFQPTHPQMRCDRA